MKLIDLMKQLFLFILFLMPFSVFAADWYFYEKLEFKLHDQLTISRDEPVFLSSDQALPINNLYPMLCFVLDYVVLDKVKDDETLSGKEFGKLLRLHLDALRSKSNDLYIQILGRETYLSVKNDEKIEFLIGSIRDQDGNSVTLNPCIFLVYGETKELDNAYREYKDMIVNAETPEEAERLKMERIYKIRQHYLKSENDSYYYGPESY